MNQKPRVVGTTPEWFSVMTVDHDARSVLAEVGRRFDTTLSVAELRDPRVQLDMLRRTRDMRPELRVLLESIPDRVRRNGAVIVRNVPVEHDSVLVLLCATLGVVTEEGNGPPDRPGELVYEVASVGSADELSKTYDELELHTDSAFAARPHRYMALGCVCADAAGGGRSMLVRVDEVVEHLRGRGEHEVIERLEHRVFELEVTGDARASEVSRVAVLQRAGTRHMVRYRADLMRADGSGHGEEHRAALDRFDAVAEGLAGPSSFALAPDDLLLFDNHRTLHGRTAISEGARRYLKRLKMHARTHEAG